MNRNENKANQMTLSPYSLTVTDDNEFFPLGTYTRPDDAMQVVLQYDAKAERDPDASWAYFEAHDFYLRDSKNQLWFVDSDMHGNLSWELL